MSQSTLVFALPKYAALGEEIRRGLRAQPGELERKHFPDGERYLKIKSDILNRPVIIVGGTTDDESTLELYDLACALVKYGATKLTLIIPFFGYSTMERASQPGEVVPAKTRARLLSSIPPAPGGVEILLLDLHSEGIPYYFENHVRAFHLYSKSELLKQIRRLGGKKFVLGSTDAGRAKWVESLAHDLEVAPAFVYKKRLSGSEVKTTGVSAEVKGQRVIIYDDMIRTGGSLIKAAEAYRAAGATEILAITTHGLFPENAYQKLMASKLFTKVVCSNSYPTTAPDQFSVAKIFIDFLLRTR